MTQRIRRKSRRANGSLRRKPDRSLRRRPQRWVWWAWGDNSAGRRVAIGWYSSEPEAREATYGKYPGDCKFYLLNTISKPAAVSMLKAKDLEEGRTIDEAMRRASTRY